MAGAAPVWHTPGVPPMDPPPKHDDDGAKDSAPERDVPTGIGRGKRISNDKDEAPAPSASSGPPKKVKTASGGAAAAASASGSGDSDEPVILNDVLRRIRTSEYDENEYSGLDFAQRIEAKLPSRKIGPEDFAIYPILDYHSVLDDSYQRVFSAQRRQDVWAAYLVARQSKRFLASQIDDEKLKEKIDKLVQFKPNAAGEPIERAARTFSADFGAKETLDACVESLKDKMAPPYPSVFKGFYVYSGLTAAGPVSKVEHPYFDLFEVFNIVARLEITLAAFGQLFKPQEGVLLARAQSALRLSPTQLVPISVFEKLFGKSSCFSQWSAATEANEEVMRDVLSEFCFLAYERRLFAVPSTTLHHGEATDDDEKQKYYEACVMLAYKSAFLEVASLILQVDATTPTPISAVNSKALTSFINRATEAMRPPISSVPARDHLPSFLRRWFAFAFVHLIPLRHLGGKNKPSDGNTIEPLINIELRRAILRSITGSLDGLAKLARDESQAQRTFVSGALGSDYRRLVRHYFFDNPLNVNAWWKGLATGDWASESSREATLPPVKAGGTTPREWMAAAALNNTVGRLAATSDEIAVGMALFQSLYELEPGSTRPEVYDAMRRWDAESTAGSESVKVRRKKAATKARDTGPKRKKDEDDKAKQPVAPSAPKKPKADDAKAGAEDAVVDFTVSEEKRKKLRARRAWKEKQHKATLRKRRQLERANKNKDKIAEIEQKYKKVFKKLDKEGEKFSSDEDDDNDDEKDLEEQDEELESSGNEQELDLDTEESDDEHVDKQTLAMRKEDMNSMIETMRQERTEGERHIEKPAEIKKKASAALTYAKKKLPAEFALASSQSLPAATLKAAAAKASAMVRAFSLLKDEAKRNSLAVVIENVTGTLRVLDYDEWAAFVKGVFDAVGKLKSITAAEAKAFAQSIVDAVEKETERDYTERRVSEEKIAKMLWNSRKVAESDMREALTVLRYNWLNTRNAEMVRQTASARDLGSFDHFAWIIQLGFYTWLQDPSTSLPKRIEEFKPADASDPTLKNLVPLDKLAEKSDIDDEDYSPSSSSDESESDAEPAEEAKASASGSESAAAPPLPRANKPPKKKKAPKPAPKPKPPPVPAALPEKEKESPPLPLLRLPREAVLKLYSEIAWRSQADDLDRVFKESGVKTSFTRSLFDRGLLQYIGELSGSETAAELAIRADTKLRNAKVAEEQAAQLRNELRKNAANERDANTHRSKLTRIESMNIDAAVKEVAEQVKLWPTFTDADFVKLSTMRKLVEYRNQMIIESKVIGITESLLDELSKFDPEFGIVRRQTKAPAAAEDKTAQSIREDRFAAAFVDAVDRLEEEQSYLEENCCSALIRNHTVVAKANFTYASSAKTVRVVHFRVMRHESGIVVRALKKFDGTHPLLQTRFRPARQDDPASQRCVISRWYPVAVYRSNEAAAPSPDDLVDERNRWYIQRSLVRGKQYLYNWQSAATKRELKRLFGAVERAPADSDTETPAQVSTRLKKKFESESKAPAFLASELYENISAEVKKEPSPSKLREDQPEPGPVRESKWAKQYDAYFESERAKPYDFTVPFNAIAVTTVYKDSPAERTNLLCVGDPKAEFFRVLDVRTNAAVQPLKLEVPPNADATLLMWERAARLFLVFQRFRRWTVHEELPDGTWSLEETAPGVMKSQLYATTDQSRTRTWRQNIMAAALEAWNRGQSKKYLFVRNIGKPDEMYARADGKQDERFYFKYAQISVSVAVRLDEKEKVEMSRPSVRYIDCYSPPWEVDAWRTLKPGEDDDFNSTPLGDVPDELVPWTDTNSIKEILNTAGDYHDMKGNNFAANVISVVLAMPDEQRLAMLKKRAESASLSALPDSIASALALDPLPDDTRADLKTWARNAHQIYRNFNAAARATALRPRSITDEEISDAMMIVVDTNASLYPAPNALPSATASPQKAAPAPALASAPGSSAAARPSPPRYPPVNYGSGGGPAIRGPASASASGNKAIELVDDDDDVAVIHSAAPAKAQASAPAPVASASGSSGKDEKKMDVSMEARRFDKEEKPAAAAAPAASSDSGEKVNVLTVRRKPPKK